MTSIDELTAEVARLTAERDKALHLARLHELAATTYEGERDAAQAETAKLRAAHEAERLQWEAWRKETDRAIDAGEGVNAKLRGELAEANKRAHRYAEACAYVVGRTNCGVCELVVARCDKQGNCTGIEMRAELAASHTRDAKANLDPDLARDIATLKAQLREGFAWYALTPAFADALVLAAEGSRTRDAATPVQWIFSKGDDELRPTVRVFARLMEAKLRENDHKGGWSADAFSSLYARLLEEAEELRVVAGRSNNGDEASWCRNVAREAADVANFAMMIADNTGGLDAFRDAGLRTRDSGGEGSGQVQELTWEAFDELKVALQGQVGFTLEARAAALGEAAAIADDAHAGIELPSEDPWARGYAQAAKSIAFRIREAAAPPATREAARKPFPDGGCLHRAGSRCDLCRGDS